jgi:tetratricopeptide (TPR) repeat protein
MHDVQRGGVGETEPITQDSKLRIKNYDRVGSVLLAASLVGLVVLAWNGRSAQGYYDMRRAETLLRDGRYSDAQALLERTLLIYDSPQERLDLSYAYLARRDADRAERQARIAINEATPPLQAAAWSQLGRVLAFAGRDKDALAAWQQAGKAAAPYSDIASASQEARSARWQSAMVYWSQANWQAARQDLESLSAGTDVYGQSARVKLAQLLAPVQPDLKLPSITQGSGVRGQGSRVPASGSPISDLHVPGLSEGLSGDEMAQILGQLRQAQVAAGQAAQRGESKAAIDTIWGGSYLQQGENTLALDSLQSALARNADYEPAHARLALALLNLGEDDAASTQTETAIKLDASDPLPHHVLANLYIQRAQWDQAQHELTILQRLEPTSIEVYLQWASYYQALGDYDKAENEYIDAANLQISGVAAPSDTNAPLTLSRFYTDVRGFGCEKGLPAARASLALHPDDPASFDAVGWALMLCNQPRDALSGLEGAVRAAPNVPRYHLHLAKAYKALGRYADAREQYNRVLDLDPGGPLERLALDDLVQLPR